MWPCLPGSPRALAESPRWKYLKLAGTWHPKLKILRNLSERMPILLESGIPNSRIYVILLNVALFVQKLPNSARKWNRKLKNSCSLSEFKLDDQGELVW